MLITRETVAEGGKNNVHFFSLYMTDNQPWLSTIKSNNGALLFLFFIFFFVQGLIILLRLLSNL